MSQIPENYRFIFRYVYGLTSFIGIAAVALVVSFYSAQRADLEAHRRVTSYHLEAALVSEQIRRRNQSLLRVLGYDTPSDSAIVPVDRWGGQFGPDPQGTLQIIADQIERLDRLQQQFRGAEFAATNYRIEERFRAVEYSILRGDPADISWRAIVSFDLAVRQLFRLHTIAVERTNPSAVSILNRMQPYLVTVILILVAAGGISWLTISLLRKSVTEQAQAEQALADNVEKLHHHEKLESIGRLAGGITHDFNNLLTAILGQTGLLLGQAKDERTRNGLNQIREAGLQAASLTRQLLDYSRPRPASLQIADVNELIKGIEVILTRVIGSDIEMSFVYGDGLTPVEVDPAQIQQVVVNLAVNARDAMPHGGRLSIETEAVPPGTSKLTSVEYPAGRYTKISVSDTGIGMDKETVDRIFEPYFTTKSRGRGTGLGLATVYGTIKGAGGRIDVVSDPGKGSRFEVLLPVSAKSLTVPATDQVPGANILGSETVLVVEDDEGIRKFLKNGLELLGYRVLVAADADEGMNICDGNRGKIDVILADIILPGKNGIEFVRAARRPQPDATIVLMSGYTDDILSRSGFEESRLPLIYKPFEIDTLASLIREQISAAAVPHVRSS